MVEKSDAPNLCALGLMSGTSLDGVDIAQITTDGKKIVELGPSATIPYSEGRGLRSVPPPTPRP